METAIRLRGAPELMVADEEKTQLSSLAQAKLDEPKTLTVISNDKQFETAGEQVKSIGQLRQQLETLLRPHIDFWHQGHKAHKQLLATLDGPLEARERSIKQGLARYEREMEQAADRLRGHMDAAKYKHVGRLGVRVGGSALAPSEPKF